MHTVGELVDLKADALTWQINQMGHAESLQGLKIFTPKKIGGTDIAKWTIQRATRRLAPWNVQGRSARRVDPVGKREMAARFGHIFLSVALDEAFLLWVKSGKAGNENATQRAKNHIKEQLAFLQALRDNLLEKACWDALQGSITMDLGEDTDGVESVEFDIDFQFKATHKGENTTLDWSDNSAKILSDPTTPEETWQGIGDYMVQDSGFVATDVYMNLTTNRYLVGNTEVYKWVSDKTKDALLEEQQMKRIDKKNAHVYENRWADAAGDTYPFIPDDTVIYLPQPSQRDSFQLLQGECLRPKKGGEDFDVVMGPAVWTKFNDDPAEVRVYYKENVLPVPTDPDRVVSRDVTPTP